MKIAIYHNLPSGGAKRAVYEMTRRMKTDHVVDIYSLSCTEHNFCDLRPYSNQYVTFPFQPIPLLKSPYGRLNQIIRILDLQRLDVLQRQIAQHIDAQKYDVVFIHNCQFGQSPALLSFLETPTVYFCHEPARNIYEPPIARPYLGGSTLRSSVNRIDPLPGLYRRTLMKIDRRNMLSARRVLVNSAFSREGLYRIYGVSAKICYLGVDSQKFRPLKIPKAGFVLSVGALHPNKGFDFIVRSLALLPIHLRPPLVIISNYVDAQEKEFLLQLAQQSNVKMDIRLLVSDEELVRSYNQAALTVYAPVFEPFGFVPLESMACGTSVVGIREGGVRESVVHGITGLLVDREPQDFSLAVCELLTDEATRNRFEENASAYVRREWNWERTMQVLETSFSQTVHQKKERLA